MAKTDSDWQKFGRIDPYYGVFSDERFHTAAESGDARLEFFRSGEQHIDLMFQTIREHFDPDFAPQSAFDFGCGVGRLVIPLARRVTRVVGADISDAMLAETASNCAERGISNVQLVKSDDALSAVPTGLDFIHSFIVLQHIPASRGLNIFRQMLLRLADNGVGAVHFTHARRASRMRVLMQRLRGSVPGANGVYNLLSGRRFSYPHMQMNYYDMNRILTLLFEQGCHDVHVRFSDHNGFLGAMLFFRKRRITAL